MAQPLMELVEQFCTFQHKQRGKTERGARTYRWNLGQYLAFVAGRRGRPACVGDLEPSTIQAWMDSMAAADLALATNPAVLAETLPVPLWPEVPHRPGAPADWPPDACAPLAEQCLRALSGTDARLPIGKIGVIAGGTKEGKLTAAFDNLVVKKP